MSKEMKPRHETNQENFSRWLRLHGHIPWTMIKAQSIKEEDDSFEIAKTLCIAQDTIDGMVEFILTCDQQTQDKFHSWREEFKKFIAKEYPYDQGA